MTAPADDLKSAFAAIEVANTLRQVPVEMETVHAVRAWVQTGQATAVVSPK
jgi:hypothetical protein